MPPRPCREQCSSCFERVQNSCCRCLRVLRPQRPLRWPTAGRSRRPWRWATARSPSVSVAVGAGAAPSSYAPSTSAPGCHGIAVRTFQGSDTCRPPTNIRNPLRSNARTAAWYCFSASASRRVTSSVYSRWLRRPLGFGGSAEPANVSSAPAQDRVATPCHLRGAPRRGDRALRPLPVGAPLRLTAAAAAALLGRIRPSGQVEQVRKQPAGDLVVKRSRGGVSRPGCELTRRSPDMSARRRADRPRARRVLRSSVRNLI